MEKSGWASPPFPACRLFIAGRLHCLLCVGALACLHSAYCPLCVSMCAPFCDCLDVCLCVLVCALLCACAIACCVSVCLCVHIAHCMQCSVYACTRVYMRAPFKSAMCKKCILRTICSLIWSPSTCLCSVYVFVHCTFGSDKNENNLHTYTH